MTGRTRELRTGRETAVRAIAPSPRGRWIHCGSFEIWPGRRLVRIRDHDAGETDRLVPLTPAQCAILMALVDAGGEPVSRLALTEIATQRPSRRIGGKARRLVDAHVCELRRRLGDTAERPTIIVTIPKVGYAIDM